jgi:hypothetical protein
MGTYSQLERAHLDGDRTNDKPENIAVLCRTCHRAHDYPEWAEKFKKYLRVQKEARIAEKDAARPILVMLEAS